MSQPVSSTEFDIAIIGMSCRFPGARNVEEFWRNLANGVESIAGLSEEEMLNAGVPRSFLEDPSYVKAAPILKDPGCFDAAFFGFSPSEAKTMDPQHRILLELAHEALEDAGCDADRHPGRVGVFTGAAMNTYFMSTGLSDRFARDYIPTLIGNDKDFLEYQAVLQAQSQRPKHHHPNRVLDFAGRNSSGTAESACSGNGRRPGRRHFGSGASSGRLLL